MRKETNNLIPLGYLTYLAPTNRAGCSPDGAFPRGVMGIELGVVIWWGVLSFGGLGVTWMSSGRFRSGNMLIWYYGSY